MEAQYTSKAFRSAFLPFLVFLGMCEPPSSWSSLPGSEPPTSLPRTSDRCAAFDLALSFVLKSEFLLDELCGELVWLASLAGARWRADRMHDQQRARLLFGRTLVGLTVVLVAAMLLLHPPTGSIYPLHFFVFNEALLLLLSVVYLRYSAILDAHRFAWIAVVVAGFTLSPPVTEIGHPGEPLLIGGEMWPRCDRDVAEMSPRCRRAAADRRHYWVIPARPPEITRDHPRD